MSGVNKQRVSNREEPNDNLVKEVRKGEMEAVQGGGETTISHNPHSTDDPDKYLNGGLGRLGIPEIDDVCPVGPGNW